LTTLAADGPHAIPVSAPVRAGEHRILLSLHRTRDSLERLRERPRVALTILAADDIAFTARGSARVMGDALAAECGYVAVAIEVNEVDDHRQPAFAVTAGIDRRWLDDRERAALGERVRTLTALARP
jgi:hypothetical protein